MKIKWMAAAACVVATLVFLVTYSQPYYQYMGVSAPLGPNPTPTMSSSATPTPPTPTPAPTPSPGDPDAQPTLTPNSRPAGSVQPDLSYCKGGANGGNPIGVSNYLHNFFVDRSAGQTVWLPCEFDIGNSGQNYAFNSHVAVPGSQAFEIDITVPNLTVMCPGDGVAGIHMATNFICPANNEGLVWGRSFNATGGLSNGCAYTNSYPSPVTQASYAQMTSVTCTAGCHGCTPGFAYIQGGNDTVESQGANNWSFINNLVKGNYAGYGASNPYKASGAQINNNVFVDNGYNNSIQLTNCPSFTINNNWSRNSTIAINDTNHNGDNSPGSTSGTVTGNRFICNIPSSWDAYARNCNNTGYMGVNECGSLEMNCDTLGQTNGGPCNYSGFSATNNVFAGAGSYVVWSTVSGRYYPSPGSPRPSGNDYVEGAQDQCTAH